MDLEQHVDDFLLCGLTSNLEVLADEFKNNFQVKKAEIVSLKPEHQNEFHVLRRCISVDNFGWHVEFDQRYVKSLLDAMAMNHCKSMATPGSKGQESSHVATDKLDPQEHREFRSGAGICQNMTEERFDIAFSTKEIMREAAGPTTASRTNLKRIARYLKGRQRCVLEFPLGEKAGRRHPCDRGCRLGWRPGMLATGPCFTVRHWSVPKATVSLSSAESEAKAITKGCIEALYVKHVLEHQTARPFKIEVWMDSSSAKAIMQRLGPARRAKHLELQTMQVQLLNKIGLISRNKLNTLENVADLLTKHVPRAALDKLTGMMGYTFPDGETQKFQEYTNINQKY